MDMLPLLMEIWFIFILYTITGQAELTDDTQEGVLQGEDYKGDIISNLQGE